MKDCTIDVEPKGGAARVVRLAGTVDAYTFPRLEFALQELLRGGDTQVVLVCQGLEYISSAGLGTLIGFARRAREKRGDLRLAQIPPRIFQIIDLLGFSQVLEIYDSPDLALASFGATGPRPAEISPDDRKP